MSESEVVFTRSGLVGGISPLAKKSCNSATFSCGRILPGSPACARSVSSSSRVSLSAHGPSVVSHLAPLARLTGGWVSGGCECVGRKGLGLGYKALMVMPSVVC